VWIIKGLPEGGFVSVDRKRVTGVTGEISGCADSKGVNTEFSEFARIGRVLRSWKTRGMRERCEERKKYWGKATLRMERDYHGEW
jgi:hypothetical protein